MNTDDKPYSLKLETEIPGTSIFYTLNGNEPDKNSFKYINPISIDHNVTLKAIAFKDDKKLEKPASYEVENHKIIGMKMIYREPFSERYPGNRTATFK